MKNTQDRNDKMFDIILEEAFEKYASDVVEEGAEYKLTDEEVAEMESKRQEIYNNIMKSVNKKSKKSFPVKRIVVLAAVLIIVLAMGFNANALKIFFYQTYTDLKGTTLNINSEKVVEESYNTIRNFENKSEIIIPGWLPPELTLENILDDEICLELYYNSENTWLRIKEEIFSSYTNERVNTENNKHVIDTYDVIGMKCSIVEIISENNTKIYIANFCSNKSNYTIMTNGSKTLLETVLKNLKYFEE